MPFFQRCRALLCRSEEWAQNIKPRYRAEVRHKRTTLPPTRSFTPNPHSPKNSPWMAIERDLRHQKKHAARHAMVKKHTPSPKKSQAAVYEYCAQAAEKRFHLSADPSAADSADLHDFYHFLSSRLLSEGPVGFISAHGRCLVESHISDFLIHEYPRLLSRHRIDVQAQLCGLEHIGSVAATVGFVAQASLSADVQLWKELSVLQMQRTATHKRLEAQDNETDRKFLKYVYTQLKRRQPATTQDLLPTMEWVRNHFYAWVSYFAQTRGDAAVRVLLDRLFIDRLTVDHSREVHPLEAKREQQQRALQAAGGWAAAVTPGENELARTSVVQQSVEPAEATREVNLLLKYAPEVPEALRGQAIDFVETSRSVRRAPGPPGPAAKGREQNEPVVAVDLRAGGALLGQGEGRTVEDAARASCLHMVHNYFLKKGSATEADSARERAEE